MLNKKSFNMSALYNKILILEQTIHFLENKIKRLEDKIIYLEEKESNITPITSIYSPIPQAPIPTAHNTDISEFNLHRENAILEDDFNDGFSLID